MKLTSADFRFLNAWVQGVDVHNAWDRYMRHRGADDLRRMRSTVRTMLDILASISKRHGDLQTAVLLRRDGARIKLPALSIPNAAASPARASAMPTLEQFAAELDDPSFYSEAELVGLLEERYGKVASLRPEGTGGSARLRDSLELRAEKRRGRLVRRQMEALRRLEVLAATAPTASDEITAWFDGHIAKRLGRVGIRTLAELMFYMRLHGYRWYRKVPRVGEGGAARLVAWLGQHEASLGELAITVLAPLRKLDVAAVTPRPATAIVPIERLRLPSTLSGVDGTNRAPPERCRARARYDYAAVMEWLELRRPVGESGNAHSFRAYRKEAERFLLWAVFERHKALSSLDHVDCIDYRRFLREPSQEWIGVKSVPRWSELWRPFEGPLGTTSRKAAETIVTSMCAWLVQVRYLDSNPWVLAPRPNQPMPLRELRSLSDKQWDSVSKWLAARAATPANDRLRMMFDLALATGMRAVELASARAGWLRQDVDEEGQPAWNLIVVGKGGKEREVPLTSRVAWQLACHLDGKGLGPSLAELDAQTPLLSALKDPMRPMNATRVYELMKAALVQCAEALERQDPRGAGRIRQASPHWMRHTHGRKFVEAGGDRGILRQNLGHASDATTAIYDRSEAKRRRREVEKVFG